MAEINTETPNGVLIAFLERIDEYKHIIVIGLKNDEYAQVVIGHDSQHGHETLGLMRAGQIIQEEEFRSGIQEEESSKG